jgi:hypothetical protein
VQSILPERGHQGRIAPATVEDPTTETFADLLDTLADLASLPGQYRMTPDAPLDRAAVDTLAELLDASGFTPIDWETAQITGTLGRARITLCVRILGGVA